MVHLKKVKLKYEAGNCIKVYIPCFLHTWILFLANQILSFLFSLFLCKGRQPRFFFCRIPFVIICSYYVKDQKYVSNSNLSLSIVYTDKASEKEEVQKEIVHEQIEVANDELESCFLWVLYRTVNFICLRTDFTESVKSYHHFVKWATYWKKKSRSFKGDNSYISLVFLKLSTIKNYPY